jgi:hypothetical protein
MTEEKKPSKRVLKYGLGCLGIIVVGFIALVIIGNLLTTPEQRKKWRKEVGANNSDLYASADGIKKLPREDRTLEHRSFLYHYAQWIFLHYEMNRQQWQLRKAGKVHHTG